jgi:hypothetical protein
MLLSPLLLLTGVVERQFMGVRQAQAEIEATQAQTTEKIEALAADVAETKEQVSRTRDELAASMRERLSQRAAAEQATVDALETNPTMEVVRETLKRATELGLIHPYGLLVPVGKLTYLRFMPVPTPMGNVGDWPDYHPDSVLVCRLGMTSQLGGELFWDEQESVEDFLEALALRLRAEDHYPGDEAFSKQAPLIALKTILGQALAENRSGERSDLRNIVMYAPNGWTITSYTVFNVRKPDLPKKTAYDFAQVRKVPYQERDAAFDKYLGDLPKPDAQWLLNVMINLFAYKILDPEDPPF